jgi:hypothetical protein
MFWKTSVTALSEEHSVMRCLHVGPSGERCGLGPLSVDVSDADADRIKSRTKTVHTVGQSGGSSDEPSVRENQTYSILSDRCSNKSFHTAGLPVGTVPSCEGFARTVRGTALPCKHHFKDEVAFLWEHIILFYTEEPSAGYLV